MTYLFSAFWLRVEVLVFMHSSAANSMARWVKFKPMFVNKTCMENILPQNVLYLINYDNVHIMMQSSQSYELLVLMCVYPVFSIFVAPSLVLIYILFDVV